MHVEHFAVGLGQSGNAALEVREQIAFACLGERILHPRLREPLRVRTPPGLAPQLPRLVLQDADQPGKQRLRCVVAIRARHHAQESLLDDILGLRPIPNHVHREQQQLRCDFVEHAAQRRTVAALSIPQEVASRLVSHSEELGTGPARLFKNLGAQPRRPCRTDAATLPVRVDGRKKNRSWSFKQTRL